MDAELWEKRKLILTATDMTILRGESDWGTEEEIWLTKKGLLGQGPLFLGHASGQILEPMIRDIFDAEYGQPLRYYSKGEKHFSSPEEYLGATPDGIFTDQADVRWGQEIKSTTEDWPCLPERVKTQCVQGMICSGVWRWKVASYHLLKGEATQIVLKRALGIPFSIDANRVKYWTLTLDEERDRAQEIKSLAKTWWETYILGDIRPDPVVKVKKPTKAQLAKMAKAQAEEDMRLSIEQQEELNAAI